MAFSLNAQRWVSPQAPPKNFIWVGVLCLSCCRFGYNLFIVVALVCVWCWFCVISISVFSCFANISLKKRELWLFNPFKPSETSHRYQLEQSLSVLSGAGCFFRLYSNFKIIEHSASKQWKL